MAAQSLRSLPLGTMIGQYRVDTILGAGGFGITYLGRDAALDRLVAIKEYMPSDLAVRLGEHSVAPEGASTREDFEWGLSRFLDEARVLARFDHPNVVRVFNFMEAHGTAYIVMDFVEGETFTSVLKREGRLSESRLLGYLTGLLSGLETVHEGGFLHRDIKPGNILVRRDGTPVLVDFGAARHSVTSKSRSVTAVVTPGYAPIEQYSSRGRQGPWTDIYALGGICYQAMTGEIPLDATERVIKDTHVPVSGHGYARSNYSPHLLAAVDAALMVDPQARPQSIAAWRDLLSGDEALNKAPVTAGSGGQPIAEEPMAGSPLPPMRDMRRTGLLIGAGLLAIVLGVTGFSLLLAPQLRVLPDALPEASAPQTTVSPSLQRRVGEVFQDPFTDGSGQGPEMVVLPSGSFTMGSPASEEGRKDNEGPQRTVRIGYRLAVGRYEITVDEYSAFVTQTGRTASDGCYTWNGSDWRDTARASWQSPSFQQSGTHPVTCVTWDDARAYAEWLNQNAGLSGSPYRYRLPNEAEWEYAARARSTTAYSFGNDAAQLADYAWFGGNSNTGSGHSTQPVGGKRPNAFGLYDMHGNVQEWVEDCWNTSHADAPTDGSARTAGDCSYRVYRGGSWLYIPQETRSSARDGDPSRLRSYDRGFRLVRTLPDEEGEENPFDRAAREQRERAEAALRVSQIQNTTPDQAAQAAARAPDPPDPAPVAEPAPHTAVISNATRRVGEVFRDGFTSGSGQGPEMVVLPSGSFTMGSPASEEGLLPRAGPQRTVRIGYRLAVGRYEVTFAQWDACIADGGCNGLRPDDRGWGRGNRPVMNVSWNDAQAYVTWLNRKTGLTGRPDRYRLPSEAEWEYAARAGTTTAYSFGDDAGQLGAHAWFRGNSDGRTHPVGGKAANAFGLHDMHGNVLEWVEDCLNTSHADAPTDGSARTAGDCSSRVARNGGANYPGEDLRSANRMWFTLLYQSSNLGFRLARTLPDLPGEGSDASGVEEGVAFDDIAPAATVTAHRSYLADSTNQRFRGQVELAVSRHEAAVERLQTALNAKGFSAGVADGRAGARTSAAIDAFRAAAGYFPIVDLTAIDAAPIDALAGAVENWTRPPDPPDPAPVAELAPHTAVIPNATRRVGDVFRDRFTDGSGQGPQMVVLPSGSFTMGSPAFEAGRREREGPQRTVQIGYRLAVGRFELTFAEWDACVADGGCNGHRPNDWGWGRGNRPVMDVSWNDAQAYVTWLNRKTGLTGRADRYRLPSEAEWEYAARAGSTTAYSFGNDAGQLGAYAWFNNWGGGLRTTHPVGGRLPNGFGLYDMHGNVRELVEDCWNESHAGASSDGSARTADDCSLHVYRGGGFGDFARGQRSASRYRVDSDLRHSAGFRIARTMLD